MTALNAFYKGNSLDKEEILKDVNIRFYRTEDIGDQLLDKVEKAAHIYDNVAILANPKDWDPTELGIKGAKIRKIYQSRKIPSNAFYMHSYYLWENVPIGIDPFTEKPVYDLSLMKDENISNILLDIKILSQFLRYPHKNEIDGTWNNAEIHLIENFKDFQDYYLNHIYKHHQNLPKGEKLNVAYDLEANAFNPFQNDNLILGFSLSPLIESDESCCYVIYESIDFKMPERDRQMCEKLLAKKILQPLDITVHNVKMELKYIKKHYGFWKMDLHDTMATCKTLNCFRSGLKQNAANYTLVSDWETKVLEFRSMTETFLNIFKRIKKAKSVKQRELYEALTDEFRANLAIDELILAHSKKQKKGDLTDPDMKILGIEGEENGEISTPESDDIEKDMEEEEDAAVEEDDMTVKKFTDAKAYETLEIYIQDPLIQLDRNKYLKHLIDLADRNKEVDGYYTIPRAIISPYGALDSYTDRHLFMNHMFLMKEYNKEVPSIDLMKGYENYRKQFIASAMLEAHGFAWDMRAVRDSINTCNNIIYDCYRKIIRMERFQHLVLDSPVFDQAFMKLGYHEKMLSGDMKYKFHSSFFYILNYQDQGKFNYTYTDKGKPKFNNKIPSFRHLLEEFQSYKYMELYDNLIKNTYQEQEVNYLEIKEKIQEIKSIVLKEAMTIIEGFQDVNDFRTVLPMKSPLVFKKKVLPSIFDDSLKLLISVSNTIHAVEDNFVENFNYFGNEQTAQLMKEYIILLNEAKNHADQSLADYKASLVLSEGDDERLLISKKRFELYHQIYRLAEGFQRDNKDRIKRALATNLKDIQSVYRRRRKSEPELRAKICHYNLRNYFDIPHWVDLKEIGQFDQVYWKLAYDYTGKLDRKKFLYRYWRDMVYYGDVEDINTWNESTWLIFYIDLIKFFDKIVYTYLLGDKMGIARASICDIDTFQDIPNRLMDLTNDDINKEIDYNSVISNVKFKACSANTGRWKSGFHTMPNVGSIRANFKSRFPGGIITAPDYAAAEVKMIAASSGEESMLEAFRQGLDIHKFCASKLFRIPIEEVTKYQRSQSKLGCLHGDTKIKLLSGEILPVRDLLNRPFEWVYSYDVDNQEMVPGLVMGCKITGKTKRYAQVTLDNGHICKTTVDHPFLCLDGIYREAQNLQVGQSLMATQFSISELHDYEMYTNPIKGEKFYTHKMVTDIIDIGSDNHVRYHINGNKLDNRPENLAILDSKDYDHKMKSILSGISNHDFLKCLKRRKNRGVSRYQLDSDGLRNQSEHLMYIMNLCKHEKYNAEDYKRYKPSNLFTEWGNLPELFKASYEEIRSTAIHRYSDQPIEPLYDFSTLENIAKTYSNEVRNLEEIHIEGLRHKQSKVHKVMAVEIIESEEEIEFYDLTVNDHHNYLGFCEEDNSGIIYGNTFALLYGASPASVAVNFNGSLAAAEQLFDSIYNAFPKIKIWIDARHEELKTTGKVTLSTNQYIKMNWDESFSPDYLASQKRHAQNYPIQGATSNVAGEVLYILLRELYENRAISKICGFTHDCIYVDMFPTEIVYIIPTLNRLMVDYPKMTYGVPLTTDIPLGMNVKSKISIDSFTMIDERTLKMQVSGSEEPYDYVMNTLNQYYDILDLQILDSQKRVNADRIYIGEMTYETLYPEIFDGTGITIDDLKDLRMEKLIKKVNKGTWSITIRPKDPRALIAKIK